MSDFGDDEWKNMICVEAGVVNTPVTLDPKNTYAAAQVLGVDSVWSFFKFCVWLC